MPGITITLPLPPSELNPNSRVTWPKRAKATKTYRRIARIETIIAINEQREERPTPQKRAIAQAAFFWPNQQRRDIANAEAMLKPAWDGIVDAGVIVDDCADVLTHEPTTFAIDRDRPRVEIRLRWGGSLSRSQRDKTVTDVTVAS